MLKITSAMSLVLCCIAAIWLFGTTSSHMTAEAAPSPAVAAGVEGYKTKVAPFFEKHCVRCHGPEKSKGKITVHSLDGDLSAGQEMDRWESILNVLSHGEMPPENEPQPKAAEREQIAKWIESGLRDYVTHASKEAPEPQVGPQPSISRASQRNVLMCGSVWQVCGRYVLVYGSV